MRIKRFLAPDMRTALRMIRDEQGPDAVILSNRATEGGIEVVAATDYDEALVAQALRAAAPALEPVPATESLAVVTTTPSRVGAEAPSTTAMAVAPALPVGAASAATNVAAPTHDHSSALSPAPAATLASTTHARESLMSRARAVFKIGDGPTLAELSAVAGTHVQPSTRNANLLAANSATAVAATLPPHDTVDTTPAPTRFEAMMAALNPPATATAIGHAGTIASAATTPATSKPETSTPETVASEAGDDHSMPASPAPATPSAHDTSTASESVEKTALRPAAQPAAAATRILQAVASDNEQPADPAIVAMRDELARMRQLMETQMEQLTLERLRGSPARAAVFDALVGYGCEESLAQTVAARIDPRLPPAEIQQPMFAELARMLTIARSEPLDDGGVIALVGPTGAGKTTTAAKLAARFAARHRARDVALVTTDGERPGAREQLHAHGRRLGITVCEAAGPEGLQEALAQLVDYPLVLVDTTGHAPRDRALFGQILWLRATRKVRSLLVLPANAHPHDLGEVIRRYRPAAPEGVVLTKLDEAGRLGSALSVAVRHGLSLAYTTQGQQVPSDIDAADATRLVHTLEKLRRAADNPLATEDRHAVV